jgi:hypothetical protein
MTNDNYNLLTSEEYNQMQEIKDYGLSNNRSVRTSKSLENLNLGIDWL